MSDAVFQAILSEIKNALRIDLQVGKTSQDIFYGEQGDDIYIVRFEMSMVLITCAPKSAPSKPYWMLRGIWSDYFFDAILAVKLINER